MFANVRRPYRPTPWQEWRRTWLTSTIGLIFVFGAFGFVLWNEVNIMRGWEEEFRLRDLALLSQQGRAVQTTRSLEEGHRDLVIPETNDVVFDENNGKLVLVADYLKVPDALVDEKYGLSIHAVKLKRVRRDLGISMKVQTTK